MTTPSHAALESVAHAVDLDRIRALDGADLQRALQEARAAQQAHEENLERLIANRGKLAPAADRLSDTASSTLADVRAQLDALTGAVRASSQRADHVSARVRALDSAQSRARQALSRVQAVQRRASCVDGIRSALATGDFEAAADHVKSYRDLEADTALVQLQGPGAGEQTAAVAEARAELEVALREQLAAAVKANDHDAVLRFAALLGPVGRPAEGADAVAAYVGGLLQERARDDVREVDDAVNRPGLGKHVDCAGALTGILRDAGVAIERHRAPLADSLGSGAVAVLITAAHDVVDRHAASVLKLFAKYRALADLAAKVASGGGASSAAAATDAAQDANADIEAVLHEILAMCLQGEEYLRYVEARLGAAAEAAQNTPGGVPWPPADGDAPPALRGGALAAAVSELLSWYVALEEHYLESSVDRAVAIDDVPAGAVVSSVVDDALYIASKCCQRAISTAHVPTACAVLTQANQALAGPLRSALAARLSAHGGRQRIVANAPGALGELSDMGIGGWTDGSVPKEARDHCVAMNDLQVCAGHIAKLRAQLQQVSRQVFSAARDRERVDSVLSDMARTASDVRAAAAHAVDQVCAGLQPRLSDALAALAATAYHDADGPGAAQGAQGGGAESPWVRQIATEAASAVTWLEDLLTQEGYNSLVLALTGAIASKVEGAVARLHFSQVGALQLDRDVRALQAQLAPLSQAPIRDRLARLTQVATLLSVESPEEAMDLWGGGDAGEAAPDSGRGAAWRLTAVEVRQLLALRVDFSAEALMALQL
ncbi:unnamed protein product [Pedinophyceae sp. YPF-701]|nr:unnamed protein product [Pedinophyceae sp. YPF-701]